MKITPETDLEPSETSMMELFTKIVSSQEPLAFSQKGSTTDVCLDSKILMQKGKKDVV